MRLPHCVRNDNIMGLMNQAPTELTIFYMLEKLFISITGFIFIIRNVFL